MKCRVKKAAIIGVGLIGGSLGMALKRTGFAEEVIGVDQRMETIAAAIELGAIDWGTLEVGDGICEADVIIVATPISVIHEIVPKMRGYLKSGATVTDVSSTKVEVLQVMRGCLPEGVYFVGGHPMAGSEKSGVKAADPYLFENAIYILTPDSPCNGVESEGKGTKGKKGIDDEEGGFDLIYDMVKAVGARPLILTPQEHDRIVACVSHLPHLIAAALVVVAMEENRRNENVLPLAAGGFRDTTRIAGSDPELWRDIFFSNKKELLEMMKGFQRVFDRFKALLETDSRDELEAFLEEIKRTREGIPTKTKGFFYPIFETVVMVQDRPGAISAVTSLLAEANLNIKDIEILHLREGEGGTLRLGFASEEEAEEAVRVLEANSFVARRRS